MRGMVEGAGMEAIAAAATPSTASRSPSPVNGGGLERRAVTRFR
jgi:hypothetical protein